MGVTPESATANVEDGEKRTLAAELDGDRLTVTIGGLRVGYRVAVDDHRIWLAGPRGVVRRGPTGLRTAWESRHRHRCVTVEESPGRCTLIDSPVRAACCKSE